MKAYNRLFIGAICAAICLFSCKKDTYSPPGSTFSGRIVYQGTPIGVENNGQGMPQIGASSGSAVYFELWQSGFGKNGPIGVTVNQDGSFSELLFDGTYKLVIPPSVGPFMSIINTTTHSDTIPVTIHGNQTMDIEVMPYYMFGSPAFTLSSDSMVSASCKLAQIITDANARGIEAVYLYANRTSFVDASNNVASASIAGTDITDPGNITLSVRMPPDLTTSGTGTASQHYFYVRLGLKIDGVADMLFTDVQKLTFN